MNFSQRLIFSLLTLMVIAGALFYFFREKPSKQPQNFSTSLVSRGDIYDLVSATGSLQPRDYVDVGAQVSGQISHIHVEVGEGVKKGALLAEIDVTVYEAKVDASRAQLKYQKAQLLEKEAQLSLSKAAYERQKRLYANDATSREGLENAETSYKIARAHLEMIKAQIQQLESTLRADEANLGYTKIYAPMEGTIVSINAKEGQTLNTNQQAPTILRIADLSRMSVKAQVSEADVNKLKRGMEVYFTTLGGNERWYSRLDKIEPTPEVTNNVVLYNALFEVENGDGRLMNNMTTQVFFIVAAAKNTLLVPASSIRSDSSGQSIVRVLDESGHINERAVRIGVRNRLQAEILQGVSEGEHVIAESSKNLEGKSPKMPPRPL